MSTRRVTINVTPIDAWEEWIIDILDPDAPEEIDSDWLNENPQGWECLDLKDRGDYGWDDVMVVDQ